MTQPYDAKMVSYLDVVGKIHTPKAGSKELDVPLIHMNALMGFVTTAVIGAVMGMPVGDETKATTAVAFNKLFWIQNDLIQRAYVD